MAISRFFIGLDLGQVKDFTAIAILERIVLKGEWDPVVFAFRKYSELRLRYLERIPLGTSYTEIVRRIANITRSGAITGLCQLVVDATGVGRPVVDMLRQAGLGCNFIPAVITGGLTESRKGEFRGIPKKNLITGLQIALQQGALQIAGNLKFGATLAAEMAEMRVKITDAGNEQFGTWREGSHDDLVFAVALACWDARRTFPGDAGERQEYWTGV